MRHDRSNLRRAWSKARLYRGKIADRLCPSKAAPVAAGSAKVSVTLWLRQDWPLAGPAALAGTTVNALRWKVYESIFKRSGHRFGARKCDKTNTRAQPYVVPVREPVKLEHDIGNWFSSVIMQNRSAWSTGRSKFIGSCPDRKREQ